MSSTTVSIRLQNALQPTSSYNRLQLLEVGDDSAERRVRLLLNTCKEALPLFVVILAALVHEDEVDTPQGRRWSPADLLILARALILQHALEGINPNVLDTIHLWEL